MGLELLIASACALGVAGAGLLRAHARRLPRRLAAAERAALAASVHDPSFDPGALLDAARRHLEPIAGLGGHERRKPFEARFGRHALDPWGLWGGPEHPELPFVLRVDRPAFHIAALERSSDDRIVAATVRVEARVRAGHALDPDRPERDPVGRRLRLVTFWIFRRRGGGWELARVEPGPAGRHRLSDPSGGAALIRRVRDESVHELVEPPQSPEIPYEIAGNLPHDAAEAVGDLALVDDRFTRDVLETSVREFVIRWELAAGEDRAPLDEVASPAAVRSLLAGGYVIRGARVETVRPARLWALRVPPELDVEVVVRAWRGPRGSVRGEVMARHHWWRLRATTSREVPWRLITADTRPLDAPPRKPLRPRRGAPIGVAGAPRGYRPLGWRKSSSSSNER
ncbi:MAG TPA: hypothetical protein VF715_07680 [Thermoleophilaceae bacterium]